MLGTSLQYVALRLLGEEIEGGDGAMLKAQQWILEHGGATATTAWGKFLLSVGDETFNFRKSIGSYYLNLYLMPLYQNYCRWLEYMNGQAAILWPQKHGYSLIFYHFIQVHVPSFSFVSNRTLLVF